MPSRQLLLQGTRYQYKFPIKTPAARTTKVLVNIEEGTDPLTSGEAIPQSNPTIAPTPSESEFIPQSPLLHDSDLEPGFYRLDPRTVRCEIVVGTIVSSIISVGILIGLVVAYFVAEEQILFWILVSCGLFVIAWLWFLSLFWPTREYRYSSWRLDESGIEIRKGVLWRHRISVPIARVQHVDVSQGPIQRQFGLAELTIHTAGTQNSSVKLEGLAHPVAVQLRDDLISKRESQDAV